MRHRQRVHGVQETQWNVVHVDVANERAADEVMDRVWSIRWKKKDIG